MPEALDHRIEKLEFKIKDLEEENIKLQGLIKTLTQENGLLKERLGLNSSNSSLPSSRDLYKIKKERPASSRKVGGQPGHRGYYRERLPADEVFEIELPNICACGGELSLSKEPYVHQKVDLPYIKPYVVEYRVAHGRCKSCDKRQKASLPEGVQNDTFGPRVKAAIASLSGFYKNSKQEVADIFNDLFNLKISTGCISNNEGRIADKCKDEYYKIEEQVVESAIVHIDETGHKTCGKRGWGWMFTSSAASLLKLTESRGKKILEASPFGQSDNIVVSDRYAVYNYFDQDKRQICLAHLSRDFARFAHSQNQAISELGKYLENQTRELFAIKSALEKKQIEVLRFLRRAKKIRRRMRNYLHKIKYNKDSVQASRVAANILKSESMMWKFLESPLEIPLTNNQAERQIRHYVVYRKNSYFTQSQRGNRFLERIISIYLTAKQQSLNPYQNLFGLLV